MVAAGAEAAVVEGSNSIVLTGVTLRGAERGVMLYQSFSGDAEGQDGSFTMTGGSLTVDSGAGFYVTNATGDVLSRGRRGSTSHPACSPRRAPTAGARTAPMAARSICRSRNQQLAGNLEADDISSIVLSLTNGSTWSGAATNASIGLDWSSSWDCRSRQCAFRVYGSGRGEPGHYRQRHRQTATPSPMTPRLTPMPG